MDLHPLDFEEFLQALGEDTAWEYIRDRYESRKPLGNILKRINELLRLYMIVGGMPQDMLQKHVRSLIRYLNSFLIMIKR